jgi:hypothetical protein
LAVTPAAHCPHCCTRAMALVCGCGSGCDHCLHPGSWLLSWHPGSYPGSTLLFLSSVEGPDAHRWPHTSNRVNPTAGPAHSCSLTTKHDDLSATLWEATAAAAAAAAATAAAAAVTKGAEDQGHLVSNRRGYASLLNRGKTAQQSNTCASVPRPSALQGRPPPKKKQKTHQRPLTCVT